MKEGLRSASLAPDERAATAHRGPVQSDALLASRIVSRTFLTPFKERSSREHSSGDRVMYPSLLIVTIMHRSGARRAMDTETRGSAWS